jgi:mannose-6-phosphate isomerase
VKTDEAAIELRTFDKFFCPAGLGPYTIEADEEVQILECFPPV